ncbi:unnamed protein product [Agarophyton chilense]
MDVMTSLMTAAGPCYLSSIHGKDAFKKSDTGRIILSFSEQQLQFGVTRPPEASSAAVQPGAILGVRRRWIRFIETVFQIRSVDVIAAVIALFTKDVDDLSLAPKSKKDDPTCMALHTLHALGLATPEVVGNGVKVIYEKAMHWENGAVDASEGRIQHLIRNKTATTIQNLVTNDAKEVLMAVELGSIGKNTPAGQTSTITGGSVDLDLNQAQFPFNGRFVGHQSLFYCGRYFA